MKKLIFFLMLLAVPVFAGMPTKFLAKTFQASVGDTVIEFQQPEPMTLIGMTGWVEVLFKGSVTYKVLVDGKSTDCSLTLYEGEIRSNSDCNVVVPAGKKLEVKLVEGSSALVRLILSYL